MPYIFKVGEGEDEKELRTSIKEVFDGSMMKICHHQTLGNELSVEKTLRITYIPQALFRVKPVTRCSSSMTGMLFVCVAVDLC